MNVNNVSLAKVAVKKEQYPEELRPEIAFVGRSNVGKSSLINTMINRKGLARTSGQPGKTQTINFYDIENQLYFVDLPGYGYARVSMQERDRWGKMIEDYLHQREQLKYVVQLIDIRHEPTKDDKMMYDWIKHYRGKVLIVATKMDKLKRSQVQKHLSIIKKALGLDQEDILIPFSSETKQGKEELWEIIDGVLPQGGEEN